MTGEHDDDKAQAAAELLAEVRDTAARLAALGARLEAWTGRLEVEVARREGGERRGQ